MYTVSEIVELGDARELILSDIKLTSVADDTEQNSFQPSEYFDE
ncbi:MAG TPA: hypothetical protein VJM50_00330 [Pyrinomonadaceae bacterium]|nr:hypothetical protein [Pyrinomonadaceae bacterium]